MSTFARWEPATRCTGGATSGARALMAWILANVDGARSGGIYNCRTVRGGRTTSLHGEGRALDVFMPMSNGRGSKAGHDLVEMLGEHGRKLGLQCTIYDRKIYSARSPGGRRYNGIHPHYDHLHIELTRRAGARLTLATIRSVLTPGKGPKPSKPEREPGKGGQKAGDRYKVGVRVLSRGDRGTDVATLQRFIGVEDDGIFGAQTEKAVRRYQRMRGLKVDAVVGPRTWGQVLSVLKV